PVRSYVIRAGRLTTAQKRALDALWGSFGLDGKGILDLDLVFSRAAPRFVEVGFGNGDALLVLAEEHPERDFIGIEVHPPGIGRMLAGLEERHLGNVRLIREDAVVIFETRIMDSSLDGVNIWFPDPWPKKRHHKRRLVQPSFMDVVTRKLKVGGALHLATDWDEYARHMLKVLQAQPGLVNLAGNGSFYTGETSRPETHFQRRGHRLGHDVWDLIFQRVEAKYE
ncbi:MAG: tRNA (guanosine(46)-N7)-methyltransferase TrmB, partial [Gammaproteobacteria bacterium]|nr:tRNA (guanosine(46)-N7)-methyltransferase TrmB [Gammaproteobacteria bacterium]